MKPAELHKAAVANIKNSVLAVIGNKKLHHLEEYLVRGNTPTNPTENMYATCMEAILGAIALDCGNDQQNSIFNVIETLCSGNIEKWLKDIQQEKMVVNCLGPKAEWITEDISDWPNVQLQAALYHSRMASPSPERSYLQRLEERCLWVFAGFGFVLFFYMRNFRK
jgi:dsRNA-specific ribonuclease